MPCAPVDFSYSLWTSQFPEFAAVSEGQAQFYFDLATVIWCNDGTGPVTKPATQLNLLNLLTAHLSVQFTQSQGDPSPGTAQDANSPVGRLDSATEGSVSIHTDYGQVSQQAAFFLTTKYGALFWRMTAQYRTARYVQGALQPGGLGPGPYARAGLGGVVYAPPR